jgi:hypothetical protein
VSGCLLSGCALQIPHLADVMETRGERFLIFLIPAPTATSLRAEVDAIGAAAKSAGESVQLAGVEYAVDCPSIDREAAKRAEADAQAVLGYAGSTHVQIVASQEWSVATLRNKLDFRYTCLSERAAPPPPPRTVDSPRLNPTIVIDRVIVVRALATFPAQATTSVTSDPSDVNVIFGLLDSQSAAAMPSIGVAVPPPGSVDVVAELISSDARAGAPVGIPGSDTSSVVDNGDGSAYLTVPFAQYSRAQQAIAATGRRNAAQSFVVPSCNMVHAQALSRAIGVAGRRVDASRIVDVEEVPIRELVVCGKVTQARPFSTLDASLGRPLFGSVVKLFTQL